MCLLVFEQLPKHQMHEEYKAITALKKISDVRSISILVIHHCNKMRDVEDPHDMISGTTAMTGAPDTILVLKRGRNDNEGILYIEGRDVEKQKIQLQFDDSTLSWMIIGNYEGLQKTQERQDIIDLLKQNEKPMSPKQISEALKKQGNAVRQLIRKLLATGDIITTKYGHYTIPNNINNNDNTNNINNNGNN